MGAPATGVLSELVMKRRGTCQAKDRLVLASLFGLGLAGCLLTGGGGGVGVDSDCPTGDERCDCYNNETCNGGLACLSDVCVRVRSDDDRDGSDGGGMDNGGLDGEEDSTSDSSNGEPDQGTDGATEPITEALQESSEHPTDVAAPDEVVANEAEPTDDSVRVEEADEVEAAPDEAEAAPDEIVPDDSPTDNPADETDTAPSETDDRNTDECEEDGGSCWGGDAFICSDGAPEARDCGGCSALGCGLACCEWLAAFAARNEPYLERPELLTGFSQGVGSVTIELAFDGSGSSTLGGFRTGNAHADIAELVRVQQVRLWR
jgi:hypothetical protein